ncbi:PTS sugar transporter subunit IIB [Streptococcus pneumoniae]
MLKIGTACGSGLGSSFMVQMNIESVLSDLNVSDVSDVEVEHYDLGGADPNVADIWIVGRDLADSASHLGDVRILNSIIDMDELRELITKICEEKGLI